MMRLRLPCLLTFAICTLALLGGCGRTTSETVLQYQYHKPPRYDVERYGSYAFQRTIDGRQQAADFGFRLSGMDALLDVRGADLVFEIALQPSALQEVTTSSVTHVTPEGEHFDYAAEGTVVVPYTYAIYDGIDNQYLMQYESSGRFPLSVGHDFASPQAAIGALENLAIGRAQQHLDATEQRAKDTLFELYQSEFLGETGVIGFHLASTAENEPRVSEAYHTLLVGLNPDNARRAWEIYRSIGFDIRDEEGKPDEQAAAAVAYGIACCAFILRDFEQVHNFIRVARTYGVSRQTGPLNALEAAAIDLEDRLARAP